MVEKLNDYQKEAVTDESQVALVNANVGSGKTTVLIAKVFYLHFKKGVKYNDMVILTFTNKAASEIKKRIMDAETGITEEDMPYFGTFHSVALKMLKTFLEVKRLGYTAEFTVMDPDELHEMAAQLISEEGFRIKYKNKLKKRFEELRSGKTSFGRMKYEDDIEALWAALVEEKKKQNKMDFDDLINNAEQLLEEEAFCPSWIIVDEFQDCDERQLAFMKALKGPDTKIFAVGDPNQIIYTWRGSKRNIFSEFKKEYQAREFTLPVNYRSSTTILEAAKCFLADGTVLQGTRETGNRIALLNHYDPFNEANYLAERIAELHREGARYRDIGVFYRLQKQSGILEEVFERANLPCEVSMRKTLKDIPVLNWFVKLLKAAVNENDTGNLISVLKDKTFGEGLSKSKIKKVVVDKTDISSVLYEKVKGFQKWCIEAEHSRDLYGYFDLDSYLSPTSAVFGENKNYVKNLIQLIFECPHAQGFSALEKIKDFVNSSALYGVDIVKKNIHVAEDSVKLMTLHACKGLEFKHVFIIGANYGLIPLCTGSLEEMEEEKRLFFVGITRAIDNLEISYYTSTGSGRVQSGQSSYLYKLPKHLIQGPDGTGEKSDLQALRREIKSNMEKNPENDAHHNDKLEKVKVRHERYGLGTVESEDENTITVQFEGYGLKEFAKGFNPLEYLIE
ncbi:MAG: ATP-dependent helicase [Eubacteriaceae bacterium]|nr:ATP-dependent helicase [Eubacteriaceae bacterium]